MGKYDKLRTLATQPVSQQTQDNITAYRAALGLDQTTTQQQEDKGSKYDKLRNPQKYLQQQATENAMKQNLLLNDTLAGVLNPGPITQTSTKTSQGIDFKDAQAQAKQQPVQQKVSPLQGKLPAAELLTGKLETPVQEQLQGKLPMASAVFQTGGGPANASQIPGISQYEINKQAIEDSNAPGLIKGYANTMNYITQGNPLGRALSRSFAGNSGVTRRDSTGNKVVDKVTDVINDFVTPIITPTGAPVGQGIIGSTYDATGRALSGKAGQKVLGTAEKIIPGSQNVVRVAATEGIAGGLQGAEFGLMQGQDSGNEIARNALLGVATGGVLGGLGQAASETLARVFGRVPKTTETAVKNSPYEGLTREQRIYRQYLDDVPLSKEDMDFMLSPDWNEANLNVKTKTPEVPEPMQKIEPVKPEVQQVEEVVQAVNEPRIRDRVYNYLDDAEKAARERIAKRRGQLNSNPLPEWTDYSIIMAAKVGKGAIKVADFTEELVKEFGEDLRPHAEKILRMTREELRKQERLASKEGQAAADFNTQAVGDINTFSQKISRVKPEKSKPFSERWQRWRTQFSDDLAALDTVERKLNGGKQLDAENSFYKAARLFKGAPEKAHQIVDDRLSPVMNMLEQNGYTSDQLEMYALARHAEDVNAAGYKSGFTDQEIQAVIDQLESPAMIEAQQELVRINRDMLQELVDSGVVSEELRDVLNDRWENYIPLFRELDSEKVSFEGGMSKALANVTSPIKALKGSEKQVIAPLENMVKNIFQTVNSAERNRVAQQIPKLAKLDTEEQFFRKMKSTEDVGQKNVLKVKVDGKEVRYEVHPEIYKAVMNLDQESSNTLLNILSKPASVLRAGATLTPEFALRNPFRDIVNAFVVSKSGFNPITDFGAGLIQTIKKGDLYKEWINNLGSYGNTLSMDRNVHKQALERVLKQPTSKKFVNLINGKTLIQTLRAISDTTESATKVGEYRAALRSGASPQEAAYRSRDLMDFARAGSSIRPANRVIAFLNANIQGKSKLIRAIKENPGGVIARGFAAVTVPTIGIYILNEKYGSETQKETIKNAPDWMKDSFWLMSIPGTDVVARIPKPFDLAPLLANLPEKALEFSKTKDPAAFDEFVQRTIKENSLPTQISGILPIIEGMANYSFFKEGQIIPKADQNLEWADQFDPVRTTTTGRILAKGAEKLTGGKGAFKNFSSPRVMDNTIQGLTAGLGKYATDAIDVILDKTGVWKRTEKPAKALEQKPLLRSFLVDPNQGGKAMDKFYTMKDELTKEKASSKLNGQLFSPEEDTEEQKTMEDFTVDIEDKLYKVDEAFSDLQGREYTKKEQLDTLNGVSDAMSVINKAIKFIEKSNLSASEKKRQIDPLVQQRNDLAKRATDFFKE